MENQETLERWTTELNPHPYFEVSEWMDDVRQGYTQRGYHEWVEANIEEGENDPESGYYNWLRDGDLF